MATIEKRKNNNGSIVYHARVRVKGFPHRAETFESKTKAKEWANKMEAAIKDGQHLSVIEAKKHTMGELIDRYSKDILPTLPKSSEQFSKHLKVWKELLGAYFLIAVKPDVIIKARDEIAKRKTPKGGEKTKSTLNRYLASLSVVFTYGYKNLEWLDVNPIEKISKYPEPRGRVRYLSDDERERLLAACKESDNPLLYPVVLLAITTGARRGEITSLTWDNVNLAEGRAILEDTKNGERRTLAIVEPALSVLRELEKCRGDGKYLFYSRRDTGAEHCASIYASWYKAMAKAGIEDFRFHDLRHTCASYLAMHGVGLNVIADILGHKTMQMTKRYSHLSDQHKQSVVERVNKEIFGGAE